MVGTETFVKHYSRENVVNSRAITNIRLAKNFGICMKRITNDQFSEMVPMSEL